MMFTREEYNNKLKKNGKAIAEFIKTEIQPYLSEDVKIKFGDIVTRGRYSEIREHKFKLIVQRGKIFGNCGGLTIYFDIPEYLKHTCGCIDIYNDYSYGGEFIYDLCLEWYRIKTELINEVKRQNKNRNAVLNDFVV